MKKMILPGLPFMAAVIFSQCTETEFVEVTKTKIDTVIVTEFLDPVSVAEGKQTFRFDTFGDEAFWSGLLHIDKAILGENQGGFGPGVSPNTALSVGLKVDAEALPEEVVTAINSGAIDLDDPASTVALLQSDAVIGVKGFFSEEGKMTGVGITCAVCHSTVDDSFAPGIGKRLDGWPNRDLNVGAIISLTDNAQALADLLHVDEATVRDVLGQWGPGKFNAGLFIDGKAFRPNGEVAANLIPAAFGMQGVNLATYTGWGNLTYWNAFVANLEMHGQGNFTDTRLNDATKFPIAAENNFGNVTNAVDLITPKLSGLQDYQLSLLPPTPPDGSYDPALAELGKVLFEGKAECASCHINSIFTDAGYNLHTAEEIGIDDFEAQRSPTGMYRTTPLRGLFARTEGGFYHDGRFPTLDDVINHYDSHFELELSTQEKNELVEYLKSI